MFAARLLRVIVFLAVIKGKYEIVNVARGENRRGSTLNAKTRVNELFLCKH